jgi:hypothetical protein
MGVDGAALTAVFEASLAGKPAGTNNAQFCGQLGALTLYLIVYLRSIMKASLSY